LIILDKFFFLVLVTQRSSCTGCAETALPTNPRVHEQSAIVILWDRQSMTKKLHATALF